MHQITILIVDDDLNLVSLLDKTFTTMLQGYLILKAISANAGMSMLKEQKPDIVILDVRLGPESGMDLLQDYYGYLQSQSSHYRPRFIVITAYPDEAVKKQALEHYKVDAFLMKPFDPDEILQTVTESVKKVLETALKNLPSFGKNSKRTQVAEDLIDKRIIEGPHENG